MSHQSHAVTPLRLSSSGEAPLFCLCRACRALGTSSIDMARGKGKTKQSSLRAAGLDQVAIKNQFVMFGPVERLHAAIAEIAPERAQEMLSASHSAAIPGKVAM